MRWGGVGLCYRTWNDTKTATHNADFLENWAAAFPDLLTHEWCVSLTSTAVHGSTRDVENCNTSVWGVDVHCREDISLRVWVCEASLPGCKTLAPWTSEPQRVASRRYLVGESYAGVYIPTLARELLHRESARGSAVARALRGLAVGDGEEHWKRHTPSRRTVVGLSCPAPSWA